MNMNGVGGCTWWTRGRKGCKAKERSQCNWDIKTAPCVSFILSCLIPVELHPISFLSLIISFYHGRQQTTILQQQTRRACQWSPKRCCYDNNVKQSIRYLSRRKVSKCQSQRKHWEGRCMLIDPCLIRVVVLRDRLMGTPHCNIQANHVQQLRFQKRNRNMTNFMRRRRRRVITKKGSLMQ